MDTKYNFLMDDMKWRIALNVMGFAVWLAAVYVLMLAAV
jgi:hypothetical protein